MLTIFNFQGSVTESTPFLNITGESNQLYNQLIDSSTLPQLEEESSSILNNFLESTEVSNFPIDSTDLSNLAVEHGSFLNGIKSAYLLNPERVKERKEGGGGKGGKGGEEGEGGKGGEEGKGGKGGKEEEKAGEGSKIERKAERREGGEERERIKDLGPGIFEIGEENISPVFLGVCKVVVHHDLPVAQQTWIQTGYLGEYINILDTHWISRYIY